MNSPWVFTQSVFHTPFRLVHEKVGFYKLGHWLGIFVPPGIFCVSNVLNCLWQHFHQLAKDNQMSNELKLDDGDAVGGMTAATEHMALNGADSQTLNFDDWNIILIALFLFVLCIY